MHGGTHSSTTAARETSGTKPRPRATFVFKPARSWGMNHWSYRYRNTLHFHNTSSGRGAPPSRAAGNGMRWPLQPPARPATTSFHTTPAATCCAHSTWTMAPEPHRTHWVPPQQQSARHTTILFQLLWCITLFLTWTAVLWQAGADVFVFFFFNASLVPTYIRASQQTSQQSSINGGVFRTYPQEPLHSLCD